MDISQVQGKVGTGLNQSLGTDDGVGHSCQTATTKSRPDTQLGSYADKLRSTGRLQLDVYHLLLPHNPSKNSLMLLRSQDSVTDIRSPSGWHEEEEMMGLCTDFHGKVRHGLQLAFIPAHHRSVYLEGKSCLTAVFHTLYRLLPCPRLTSEPVMLFRVKGVERNPHTFRSGSLQL